MNTLKKRVLIQKQIFNHQKIKVNNLIKNCKNSEKYLGENQQNGFFKFKNIQNKKECFIYNRSVNHAVLAVGFDDNDNWFVKNSWGNSWGEKGFITLAPGNTCGITSYAYRAI